MAPDKSGHFWANYSGNMLIVQTVVLSRLVACRHNYKGSLFQLICIVAIV